MLNNSQIKYHAKKIIDVFGKLVEGVVGHAELDNSSLERLGRNHFHYGVKVDDFVVSIKLNLFSCWIIFLLFKSIKFLSILKRVLFTVWKSAQQIKSFRIKPKKLGIRCLSLLSKSFCWVSIRKRPNAPTSRKHDKSTL